MASVPNQRPLQGLLVVAMEGAIAGPFASCKLADAGARVIKVERAKGDMSRGYDQAVQGQSSYFVWLNRGKESVQLDCAIPADLAVLQALLAQADVFIQNLGPGATAKMGFSAAALRAKNERLIVCDISGYGPTGPYADMKAYELLIQAESGLVSVTGTPEQASRVGVSACDISAGMNAHAGILEALYHRERTGQGTHIEVSLFGGLAEWMAVPLMHYEHQHTIWPRVSLGVPTLCPYAAYPTQDAEIVIGVSNDDEWQRLVQVIGRPELLAAPGFATNVDRVANRAQVDEVVRTYTRSHTAHDVAKALQQAGIAFGRINDVAALAVHPQLKQIRYDTPAGEVSVVAPAVTMPAGRRAYGPVPSLGEHTSAVRAEFAPGTQTEPAN